MFTTEKNKAAVYEVECNSPDAGWYYRLGTTGKAVGPFESSLDAVTEAEGWTLPNDDS
jgi:hypothetical protein